MPESQSPPRRLCFGLLDLRRDETAPFLCAAAYSFCLMASYNVLKPFRDALGTATKGIGWLWTGTFFGCLIVLPPYWALVARLPRQRFIPWVHRSFALLFVVFFFLLRDEKNSFFDFPKTAGTFYVIVSVFNLLVLSQLWGFLSDVFKREQGHRLFAWIAAGGTAGGLVASFGSTQIAGWMAREGLEPAHFLWLAVVLLECATIAALRLARHAGPAAWKPPEAGRTVGAHARSIFEGVRLLARSPYLLAIVGYMFVSLYTSSCLYNFQRELMKSGIPDRARQVEYQAGLNTLTQLLALAGQTLLSATLLRRAGLTITLAILPVVGILALVTFGAAPTLQVVAIAWVAFKAVDYALAKPAREALFTVVSRAEKYQSKSLIDAGLYRFFDMVDGWAYDGLKALSAPLTVIAFTAAPISALGLFMSRRIAREQARRRDDSAAAELPPPA